MARKISRSTSVSVRVPNGLLDDLEMEIEKGEFRSVSDAVIKCTEVGLEAIRYKEMIKDPKKAEEFATKVKELVQQDELFTWAETLSTEQVDAFVSLLKMEKEKRVSVRKFV